jgi:hypothetical protein
MVEIDKEALYAELDALPEMVVRSRLEKGVWRDEKSKLVERYLHEKALGREKEVQADQIDLARRANNIAFAAIIIAALALLVSLLKP